MKKTTTVVRRERKRRKRNRRKEKITEVSTSEVVSLQSSVKLFILTMELANNCEKTSKINLLFEEKMREQLQFFNTSAEHYKLKRANTVPVSKDLKLDDALARIKLLEDKQDEMLRLHAAMFALVSDLVGVVSTSLSGQTVHLLPQPLLPQPRSFTECEVNTDSSLELPLSLPPKVAIKEEFTAEQLSDVRKEEQNSNERKEEQKLHIQHLSEYIDERAAHYSRGRPTPSREPYPRVDWSRINPNTKRNLPQPTQLPVSGCPQDPNIYPDSPNPEGRVMEWYRPITQCFLPGCDHTDCHPPAASTTTTYSGGCSSDGFNVHSRNEEGKILLNKYYKPLRVTSCPFGTAAGFETNLGVVAPPVSPIRGYIYTVEGWKLHATPG